MNENSTQNIKTRRSLARRKDNLAYIRSIIGDYRADAFEKILESYAPNRKLAIGREQIEALCGLAPNEISAIIDMIIRYPQDTKQIIVNTVPGIKTKVTITLPVVVSEWLDDCAADDGLSKSKYIEGILQALYDKNED